MDDKKVLLSVKDLEVKFRVRGRILTAIRNISLDIYENESIAIVGESGSGKSVFTKTFAGMLDENGFIDNGEIIFSDDELADTYARYGFMQRQLILFVKSKLDKYSHLEFGGVVYGKMQELKSKRLASAGIDPQLKKSLEDELSELRYRRTEAYNLKQTLDPKSDKQKIKEVGVSIKDFDRKIKEHMAEIASQTKKAKQKLKNDAGLLDEYKTQLSKLQQEYQGLISGEISDATRERNLILAKEVCLSVDRYGTVKGMRLVKGLLRVLKEAMRDGLDLNDDNTRNRVFDKVAFRVRYLDETEDRLHGTCILNLANIKFSKDWNKIRGRRIATVFQDPMTSLNPIITIGKQITSVIIKHQGCSLAEARERALILMKKVGIPNAEKRFDDYPFQYSGGMRQRIVIAIALSCQPKILICDEPTTALDVTIQAQILKLLKDLQKEFGYTIVFITHDLGVVANIADRVAVLYAGQIVELATVDEIFYDPRHPYTWALLSSLPQLAQRNTKLYSIFGTPPSLYNKIIGDPFAPRNPYCLKIDTLKEAPMFKVSDTHYAKTWLLDPRAPKLEKPEIIRDIHGTLLRSFNI